MRRSAHRQLLPLVFALLGAAPALAAPVVLEARPGAKFPGLWAATSIVVSADGTDVYVMGRNDGTVVGFRRDAANGALLFFEQEQNGVDGVEGLNFAFDVALSPDGTNLYAAGESEDAVVVFGRDTGTGLLTYVDTLFDGVGGVDGLFRARTVAVSPDSAHVYVGGSEDAVAVFARDGGTGALSLVQVIRNDVGGVDGIDHVSDIAVSPDGTHVYVTGEFESTLAVFDRDVGTGELAFVEVEREGVAGVSGLNSVDAVALSEDGAHVYTGGQGEVGVFSRDAVTGALSFVEVEVDGVGGVDGLAGEVALAVSADGGNVYAVGESDDSLVVFSRDAGSGTLGFVERERDGIGGIDGLDRARSVVVHPDGDSVYVGSWNDSSVAVFDRDPGTGAVTQSSLVKPLRPEKAIAVSPDDAHVYGASFAGAVEAFVREPSGVLRFLEGEFDGVGGANGLAGASGVAVSPDGDHVYVASSVDDAVAMLTRDAGTGLLEFGAAVFDGMGGADGLDGAATIALSPDGAHAYVAAADEDAISVLARDAGTGALGFVEAERDGVGAVDGLDAVRAVALSADGAHVYAASDVDDAVVVFARNAVTGGLTFVQALRDGVGGTEGLDGASGVAVSPDGSHVFVAGTREDELAIFTRDAGTGALTFLELVQDGKRGVSGLDQAGTVVLSPDGEQVYVGGIDYYSAALGSFARDPATGILSYVERVPLGAPLAVTHDGSTLYAGRNLDAFAAVSAGCTAAPMTDCRTASRGTLRLLRSSFVLWRWTNGDATTVADFGNPHFSGGPRTHYALCLYDESGPTPAPLLHAFVPGGGGCRGKANQYGYKQPCWQTKSGAGAGYKYKDPSRTPEGIVTLELRSGLDGEAKISLSGGRERLHMPVLPLALPVRAQLQNSDGACWEATYSTPATNNADGFTAASD
jgi:6-phosphogluconolactonase (cycloisomerase 2 family)